jgi:hypothetical protein
VAQSSSLFLFFFSFGGVTKPALIMIKGHITLKKSENTNFRTGCFVECKQTKHKFRVTDLEPNSNTAIAKSVLDDVVITFNTKDVNLLIPIFVTKDRTYDITYCSFDLIFNSFKCNDILSTIWYGSIVKFKNKVHINDKIRLSNLYIKDKSSMGVVDSLCTIVLPTNEIIAYVVKLDDSDEGLVIRRNDFELTDKEDTYEIIQLKCPFCNT